MNIKLPSLLGVLFIALKLTGHIDWSWIWVLSPFWIGLSLYALAIILAIVVRSLEDSEQ